MALVASTATVRAEELTPEADQLLELQIVANTLTAPTGFDFLPDGSIVVAQKAGQLMRVVSGKATLMGKLTVDTASEKGLLNVLVPPDYGQHPHLLLYYSAAGADASDEDKNRVVSIDVLPDHSIDLASEKILLRGILGPRNHDGGGMTIGKDGYLYVGVGDSGCDTPRNANPKSKPSNYYATCLSNPNGKLLRIALDGQVPESNPFNGVNGSSCGSACNEDASLLPPSPARPEIFALGFRNPWRIWSDSLTGNIWVGDVGGTRFEEVDVVTPNDAGRHFGWPWREATTGYTDTACQSWNDGQLCRDPAYFCAHAGFEGPGVDGGCESITGGVIVDACTWPSELRGSYIFGDNAKDVRKLYALKVNEQRDGIVANSRRELGTSTGMPVHFAIGPEGDVYYTMIGISGGSLLLHLAPKAGDAPSSSCAAAGAGGASNGDAGAPASSGGAGGHSGEVDSSNDAGMRSTPALGGAPDEAPESSDGAAAGAKEPPTTGANPEQSSGCGCALPGGKTGSDSSIALGLCGLALLRARQKARPQRRRP